MTMETIPIGWVWIECEKHDDDEQWEKTSKKFMMKFFNC